MRVLCQYFAAWTIPMEMVLGCVFVFENQQVLYILFLKDSKMLTNEACLSSTGEWWPLIVSLKPWVVIIQRSPRTRLVRGSLS